MCACESMHEYHTYVDSYLLLVVDHEYDEQRFRAR